MLKQIGKTSGKKFSPPNFSVEVYRQISEKVKSGQKPLCQYAEELGVLPNTLRARLQNFNLVTQKERQPLTPLQAKVLALHRQGLSNAMIEERLHRSKKSVRTLLSRAKQAERGILRRKGPKPIQENRPHLNAKSTTPTSRQ